MLALELVSTRTLGSEGSCAVGCFLPSSEHPGGNSQDKLQNPSPEG